MLDLSVQTAIAPLIESGEHYQWRDRSELHDRRAGHKRHWHHTHVIGIKYDTKSIAGASSPVSPMITYTFATSLSSSASVLPRPN